MTTDCELVPQWESEVRQRMPTRMNLLVFQSLGRHTHTMSFPLVQWLRENIGNFDLVVVRLLFHPLSSACAYFARRIGVPFVITPHGTLSRYTFRHRRRRLKKAYFSLVERYNLAAAAGIHFTCEAERIEAARLHLDASSVVIPHPYEGQLVEQAANPDDPTLVFLSRLDPVKGIELLYVAFAEVLRQEPSVRLVVAGSGGHRYEMQLRHLAAQLGISASLELRGFLHGPEKERALRNATVFVLPSHHESYGLAAVEAMGAGVPVVLTRGVGISNEVAECGAGIAVDADPASLAREVLRLLRDPDARAAMGAAGRRLVRERFSPQVIGPRTLSFYSNCMRSGRASIRLAATAHTLYSAAASERMGG